MKIFTITVLALLTITLVTAQPVYNWAKKMGGTGIETGRAIATDAAGNVYTAGTFQGTADFDPGSGIQNLSAVSGLDIFITKFNAAGDLIWVKSIAGTGDEEVHSITVDASGSIYTTGNFTGTIDLDPGAGTQIAVSAGVNDIFISKLDASGNLTWATALGEGGNEYSYSIAVDAFGNVYTAGYFFGTIDFDPGPGAQNLTSAGSSDAFVYKLDAAGNFVWAKSIGGSNIETGKGIALDPSGYVFITGDFIGTGDFDPGAGVQNLTAAGNSDIFVCKLDASGNFVWAKSIGGAGSDGCYGIAADASGNVYTTGSFSGMGDFDPGTGTQNLTSAGGYDIFVSKLDASGNYVWAKSIGGTGNDWGYSLTVDASNNVYFTGIFRNTVDFDPGPGIQNITAAGSFDIFISRLDASGSLAWVKSISSSGDENAYSIAVNGTDNVYVTGYFLNTVDFDPGAGARDLTSAGASDAFIVRLSPSQSLSISVTTTEPTCGASNGTILVTATGGTPPYTYSVNGFYQNNGYFDGRGPGAVIMGVKDATGTIQTTTVTLTETKHQPHATAAITNNPTACNGINGVVTLSPVGGVPPYQYSFDYDANYQTSNVFSNLSFGQYAFYVMDANGCVGYAPLVNLIDNNCPIVVWGWSYGQIMFCNQTGYIRITGVSGGTPPYQYSIDGINYQVSPDFNSLAAGIYNVYVKDATGFTKVLAFQISTACRVDITYVAVDAACLQNDGALTITASKGTPPYTYSIDGINYQSGNIFTGLAAGTYTVTVKDAANKVATRTATVYDRCPVVSLAATGETCQRHDGTVTATATKGTPPYQYSIDGVNFQTNNVFTGLDAGDYTVTLKDALSFTSVAIVKVENVCLNVSAGATNSTCGNSNGSILISASNGTAPYQYSIDGINFQPGNSFTGLVAGPYTVLVKDATGKTGNATITVNNTAGPQINATGIPALCNNNEGTINISAVGGTTPYMFSIDGTTYQNSGTFNNRASGAYTAWIKDANGCTVSQPVPIALNCPSLAANFVNETCGSSNASITASATGGTPPYQFSIDGINFQNNTIFSNLTAGTYTVAVKDVIGAIKMAPVTINNICPTVSVVVTNGLCGTANASLVATGANGTAPYEYSMDGTNFQFNNSFTGLTDGTYTVTIRDVNGLTNTTSAVVQNFPGPTMLATSSSASCLNNDASINISSTGGTLPLQYSIDGTTFLSRNVFNGLPRGDYVATVKDANGCLATQAVVVPVSNNLFFNAGNNPTICEGSATVFNCTSNGSIFNWFPSTGVSNPSILNPSASPAITTTYYVIVSLGICIRQEPVTVFVNPAPVADAGNGTTICYGQSAQLSGGGGLTYNWTPVTYLSDATIANPVVVRPSSTTSYALTVTDGNGCKSIQPSTATITVTPPAKIFAGNDTTIVMNQPFILQAKDVNNSGFTQYAWTPSYGLNNSATQNPETLLDRNMTYTVMATTPQGCSGTDAINIKVYQGPEIYVPNAFSPNSDGNNDVLRAIPVGIKEFRYFNIYNRWGQLIFSTKDPSRGWSGEINHVSQTSGTFVWLAEGIDGKGNSIKRRGTVTLIR